VTDTPISKPDDSTDALLRRLAAPRRRVVDDHNFVGIDHSITPGTFRLQLFTAPGNRSVAVATQAASDGPSLTNLAETYAAVVWQRHCPEESEPPVWIEHYSDMAMRSDYELVTFAVDGPFQLSKPGWTHLSAAQLTDLVGDKVDPGRGENYIPTPEPPQDELRYEIVAVSDLPPTRPYRTRCMAAKDTMWHRLAALCCRWTRGRAPGCCWYHAQDWHAVSEHAIRLVEQARRDGLADRDLADSLGDRVAEGNVPEKHRAALRTLLSPARAIDASLGPDGAYTNGNHRSRALRDAGVQRTVMITWTPPATEK
jgi:hypothetical protein